MLILLFNYKNNNNRKTNKLIVFKIIKIIIMIILKIKILIKMEIKNFQLIYILQMILVK